MGLFQRTTLTDRQERASEKAYEARRARRRKRFRILACIDGTDEAFLNVRFAAQLAPSSDCDIIILFVRPIDQGLWSGGLQVRLARQNLLEAGFELPGLRDLRKALEILEEEGIVCDQGPRETAHQDAWGDPLGDNKVVFTSAEGRTVVLKLKTAPDPASGILDQYELGPYNLMILGEPSRWRNELVAAVDSGIVQKVVALSPCSVLVVRDSLHKSGFFICTDGTARSMQAVRRSAVLAHETGEPITLFCAADKEKNRKWAEQNVKAARNLLKALGIRVKKTVTGVGRPAQEIVRHGNDHKIIVVTDEGRSRLQRLVRGSTANEVVRIAETSVLDVR